MRFGASVEFDGVLFALVLQLLLELLQLLLLFARVIGVQLLYGDGVRFGERRDGAHVIRLQLRDDRRAFGPRGDNGSHMVAKSLKFGIGKRPDRLDHSAANESAAQVSRPPGVAGADLGVAPSLRKIEDCCAVRPWWATTGDPRAGRPAGARGIPALSET